MNSNEMFSTKDLVLASYIVYKGIKLAKGYDAETLMWYFEDPVSCEEAALELRNSETQVEVLHYETVRRNLLGMVYDKRPKPRPRI